MTGFDKLLIVKEVSVKLSSRLEELIPQCADLARNIHRLMPAPGSFPAQLFQDSINFTE
ncbi:MAG: hypothetical protein IJT21_02695 [Synergistaceae bacterium]|nr:hypothetical protein [Synergistaceae bacterium]